MKKPFPAIQPTHKSLVRIIMAPWAVVVVTMYHVNVSNFPLEPYLPPSRNGLCRRRRNSHCVITTSGPITTTHIWTKRPPPPFAPRTPPAYRIVRHLPELSLRTLSTNEYMKLFPSPFAGTYCARGSGWKGHTREHLELWTVLLLLPTRSS